ncbi:hypothetical protein RSPO_c01712 [Ralstonia solanacearum Po82]|uniref:Uncharacterized protein n=1 Tax=Ralstonia solanacearum (strain Po82) TaxID=1031711 RepID=F6G0U3_RALS8|nr:hypothetical protein RSPO_c01712 [Ralstonia solanacearum Po82]
MGRCLVTRCHSVLDACDGPIRLNRLNIVGRPSPYCGALLPCDFTAVNQTAPDIGRNTSTGAGF